MLQILTEEQTKLLMTAGGWCVDHAVIPAGIWGYHKVKKSIVAAKSEVVSQITAQVESHIDARMTQHESLDDGRFNDIGTHLTTIDGRVNAVDRRVTLVEGILIPVVVPVAHPHTP